LLDGVEDEPFAATFVGRSRPAPGAAQSSLLVERRRVVGRGMRDDIVVHNLADEASYCRIEVRAVADFADVRHLRAGTLRPCEVHASVISGGLEFVAKRPGGRRSVRLRAGGEPHLTPGSMQWEAIVPPRGSW